MSFLTEGRAIGRELVPVCDPERPRNEQDPEWLAKHRHFDNPFEVSAAVNAKTLRKNEAAKREMERAQAMQAHMVSEMSANGGASSSSTFFGGMSGADAGEEGTTVVSTTTEIVKGGKGKGKKGKGKKGKGGWSSALMPMDQFDTVTSGKLAVQMGDPELTRDQQENTELDPGDKDTGEGVKQRKEVEQQMLRNETGLWVPKKLPKDTIQTEIVDERSSDLTQTGNRGLLKNVKVRSLLVSEIKSDVAHEHWTCTGCKTVNIRLRKHCTKCGQPYTELHDLLKVDQKRREQMRKKLPTGWECGSCRYVNKPNRSTCFKCSESKMMGEPVYADLDQYNRGYDGGGSVIGGAAGSLSKIAGAASRLGERTKGGGHHGGYKHQQGGYNYGDPGASAGWRQQVGGKENGHGQESVVEVERKAVRKVAAMKPMRFKKGSFEKKEK
eukprot:g6910.t1